MVFYHHDLSPAPERLPRYLDLGYYASIQGSAFTFSSNLLHALQVAVKRVPWERRFAELTEQSQWLRARLSRVGLELVGTGTQTSPAVVTIALPTEKNSSQIGGLLRESGFLISYESDYLRRYNWVQVCLMGESSQEKLVSLSNSIERIWVGRSTKRPSLRR
jgi:aspartate aminotransferase-like enzyme